MDVLHNTTYNYKKKLDSRQVDPRYSLVYVYSMFF